MESKDDYPDRDKFEKNDFTDKKRRNILSLDNINSDLDEILAKGDYSKREDDFEDFKIDTVDIVYLKTLESTINNCIITCITEICNFLEILYMIKVDLKVEEINYNNIVEKIIKNQLYNKKYVYNYLSKIDESYADYIKQKLI